MALVFRNGRPRLQRSVRRDGRVTSEYVAGGETTLLFAKIEAGRREEQEMERWDFEAELDAASAVEEKLNDHFERVEDLARAALYAAGYHRPKRQWRRRRERRQESCGPAERPLPDISAPGAVREILARAAKGEEAMRPLVLKVLDREQKAGDGGCS